MVMSYSAIAQPTSTTPQVISIASPASSSQAGPSTSAPQPQPESQTSNSDDAPTSGPSSQPAQVGITHLILDAGPLLSLAPLRHLAQTFHTTPMVLAELRDPKAREHWERLKLSGVDVRVEKPTAEAMSKGEYISWLHAYRTSASSTSTHRSDGSDCFRTEDG